MTHAEVLAQLLRQEQDEGGDLATLRAIVEEAGDLGASRAMKRLGLADDAAPEDLRELRDLLRAWRDAKRSALRSVVAWITRMLLALVLVGLAFRMGPADWAR